MVSGNLRYDEPGTTLNCLLLAPAPDWVAVDLASGALFRSSLSEEDVPAGLSGSPLDPVSVRLAAARGPFDPSRPEAVSLIDAVAGHAPRKRAIRRLLSQVTRSEEERGRLLGSVGPSLAFPDLEGTRPSVALLSPAHGRVHLAGDDSLVAHFQLGDVGHALPVTTGLVQWIRSGQIPTSTGAARKGARARASNDGPLGPGLESSVPVLIVAGLDRPQRGQVRKVVLGMVPAL